MCMRGMKPATPPADNGKSARYPFREMPPEHQAGGTPMGAARLVFGACLRSKATPWIQVA